MKKKRHAARETGSIGVCWCLWPTLASVLFSHCAVIATMVQMSSSSVGTLLASHTCPLHCAVGRHVSAVVRVASTCCHVNNCTCVARCTCTALQLHRANEYSQQQASTKGKARTPKETVATDACRLPAMNSAKKRSFSEEMKWEQPATTTKFPLSPY
eukprot:10018-Heterococcus_DN1.PRE.2